ncbi:MAG: M1 family peptidase, partial [Bacteroidetes bacterium]|nr:M1 family peptidase [Bacteroidota bacterium]
GEDLSWFWKEWFYNNWQLDIAIQSVSYKDNDEKNGADIVIANLQKMAMPFTLEINYADGTKTEMPFPVETWLQSSTHFIHLPATQHIQSVIIDPEKKLPDSNRSNNEWK